MRVGTKNSHFPNVLLFTSHLSCLVASEKYFNTHYDIAQFVVVSNVRYLLHKKSKRYAMISNEIANDSRANRND